MFQEKLKKILTEIYFVLSKSSDAEIEKLIDEVNRAQNIVAVGAGRVGMATRGFAMRLGHMGYNAFMWGDATVPHVGPGDLLLVSSGSGETPTIKILVEIAKKNGARVALITGNPQSSMGILADSIVQVRAPSKTKPLSDMASVQPMTTLNEQSLQIFFDTVVLLLMEKKGETHDTMWGRHSNLE